MQRMKRISKNDPIFAPIKGMRALDASHDASDNYKKDASDNNKK